MLWYIHIALSEISRPTRILKILFFKILIYSTLYHNIKKKEYLNYPIKSNFLKNYSQFPFSNLRFSLDQATFTNHRVPNIIKTSPQTIADIINKRRHR